MPYTGLMFELLSQMGDGYGSPAPNTANPLSIPSARQKWASVNNMGRDPLDRNSKGAWLFLSQKHMDDLPLWMTFLPRIS